MTSGTGKQQERGGGGLLSGLKDNPAVSALGDAAKDYAKARGGDLAKKVGERVSGATDSLNGTAENGGFKATAVGEVAKRVTQGENPVKAALGGVGSGIKEKVGEVFGRKKSGGSGNKKFMTIIEDIHIGVPVNVAYDQWTQFQEFASFMKGVESVDQTDEVSSNWRAKVAKSRRNWKATVTEQIPDRKIAWTTEGQRGRPRASSPSTRWPTTSPRCCWSSSTTRRGCSRRRATSGAPRAAAPDWTSSTSAGSS